MPRKALRFTEMEQLTVHGLEMRQRRDKGSSFNFPKLFRYFEDGWQGMVKFTKQIVPWG